MIPTMEEVDDYIASKADDMRILLCLTYKERTGTVLVWADVLRRSSVTMWRG